MKRRYNNWSWASITFNEFIFSSFFHEWNFFRDENNVSLEIRRKKERKPSEKSIINVGDISFSINRSFTFHITRMSLHEKLFVEDLFLGFFIFRAMMCEYIFVYWSCAWVFFPRRFIEIEPLIWSLAESEKKRKKSFRRSWAENKVENNLFLFVVAAFYQNLFQLSL